MPDAENAVSLLRKALNCTLTAKEALKEHPEAWNPTDKAMGKLYWKALSVEGLGDFEGSLKAGPARRSFSNEEVITRLETKILKSVS